MNPIKFDLERAELVVCDLEDLNHQTHGNFVSVISRVLAEVRQETAEECANIAGEYCFYEIEGIIRKKFLK